MAPVPMSAVLAVAGLIATCWSTQSGSATSSSSVRRSIFSSRACPREPVLGQSTDSRDRKRPLCLSRWQHRQVTVCPASTKSLFAPKRGQTGLPSGRWSTSIRTMRQNVALFRHSARGKTSRPTRDRQGLFLSVSKQWVPTSGGPFC